ncbi:dihydroorotate dehydrogenase electron transfer subunit [Steroidobacter denitrificans]|uniref:Dihydroorotate dehydrogenase electron transfer subunit n=1 Tax=Steroidobacter denitrificans TaxID=465721 RepID=A0A127F5S4_STEDE|nr:dihydroorotate dehydrogenase electron transfer subunit [Steroidobacter denitrificans]AMN45786.1 dihydroorotate dehydrogenase electron transfer subunit [Steroidobacter denitrificans]
MSQQHPHRGTLFLEDAEILSHQEFDGRQYVLKLHAPKCAQAATPGSFIHLSCDPSLPMRRPLSIMRAHAGRGTIEILYKVVGAGLTLLSHRKVGEQLSCLGPIGQGFRPHPQRPHTLLVGGGVGIPPMIFLAEALLDRTDAEWQPLVLMGSEIPFPFRTRPSTILVPGMPDGTIACMPLLEEWGIPSRLASLAGYAGCHDGYVSDLAAHWLSTLDQDTLARTELFACGPTPMLEAITTVARRFEIPCQVSLEEFMACGVGGCAGCAVRVETPDGPAMKRICVDGPVFDAMTVFAPS